ncbi:MAG: ATP-binding cassette domain-containing protein [Methanosarcinales archaeon]|nr:ATP-binding cassette domain-containing protein [Methanosarcinales archaeon]
MLEIDIHSSLRDFELEVSLRVKRGEMLMLMGENGCGKTTVLNSVAGLFTPGRGEIILDGRILFDSRERINLPPAKRRVGYVFQNYALFPHMTVLDNVAFGLCSQGIPRYEAERRAKGQLQAFDLWEVRQARAFQISGGQKQRTALARALAIQPELLLLDEPLSALDITKQGAMRQELQERVKECDVPSVMVTHDPRDVAQIGDRVCLLERGKVVRCSPAEEIASWGMGPGGLSCRWRRGSSPGKVGL